MKILFSLVFNKSYNLLNLLIYFSFINGIFEIYLLFDCLSASWTLTAEHILLLSPLQLLLKIYVCLCGGFHTGFNFSHSVNSK
uniref:Uncharacterized protein n=1 Tax=viral metagenome TaxID=1070528 RepID=A0A6C0JBG4_9ZZZZ